MNKNKQVVTFEKKSDSFVTDKNSFGSSYDSFQSSGVNSDHIAKEKNNIVIKEKGKNYSIINNFLEATNVTAISKISSINPNGNLKNIKKGNFFSNLDLKKNKDPTQKENIKIKQEEKRYYKTIILIDILSVLADLFCVTMLYFDVQNKILKL